MAEEVTIPAGDVVGEQVILAAVVADWDGEGAKILDRHHPDLLSDPRHRAAFAALREMRRRRLEFDWATLQRLAGDEDVSRYLQGISERRPDRAADLAFHVANAEWDRKVAQVAGGPLPALIEGLQKRGDPDRSRALARTVSEALQGGGGGEWFHDRDEIVREQVRAIRDRIAGRASYPFGIPGFDVDSETGRRRLLPGAAPGQITVVTGVPGSGKSTFTANLVLGLARQGRRILYGSWEMSGGTTLELLACISLGMSRSRLLEGSREIPGANGESSLFSPLLSEEEVEKLRERMELISERVTFMRNPFRRGRGLRGEKKGRDWEANDRNLDIVHEYIADSGCDVFVGDLWKRCLKNTEPDAEEDGLLRQQAMVEELQVHAILLQQQRLHDIEQRADKRPTREGVKGSGAWTEVPDNMFGTHRAAQWKHLPDDKFEVGVLKQRYGRWPLAVEFDWDGDTGSVSGGRSIEWETGLSEGLDGFVEPEGAPKRRGRGGGGRPKRW
jgi:replicative DNA helicase